MNVVICGAGEVGSHAAEVLAAIGHRITILDLILPAEYMGVIHRLHYLYSLHGVFTARVITHYHPTDRPAYSGITGHGEKRRRLIGRPWAVPTPTV